MYAVHARHSQVADQKVEVERVQSLERGGAVVDRGHFVALIGQGVVERFATCRFVVCYQD